MGKENKKMHFMKIITKGDGVVMLLSNKIDCKKLLKTKNTFYTDKNGQCTKKISFTHAPKN